MATKTVGVKYKIDVADVQKADMVQQRYVTTLKKLNQIHRTSAQSSQILAATFVEQQKATSQQVQALQQLVNVTQQGFSAIQQQNDALLQQVSAITQNNTATQQNTQVTQQNTQARGQNTDATDKNAKAFLRNVRTLVFWTVGAASVFRLVSKIRGAFIDTLETIFRNTQEYERLQAAQNGLKVSVVGVIGGYDTWKQAIEFVSQRLERLTQIIIIITARTRAFTAGLTEDLVPRAVQVGTALLKIGLAVKKALEGDFAESSDLAAQALNSLGQTVFNTDAAQDAFNKSIKDSLDLQGRYAEAIKDTEEEQKKLEKAQRAYEQLLEKIVRAEQKRIDALIDLFEEVDRRTKDIETETGREFDDLAIDVARKREDIEIKFRRRIEDIQLKQRENRRRAEDSLRLALLRIELKFQEKLIQIQEQFQLSFTDAVRRRDALALVEARRRRDSEISAAERQRNDERLLAFEQFKIQLAQQQRSLQDQRAAAELARQRELEDLAMFQQREAADILRDQSQKLNDLRTFQERRRQDIETDYNRQIEQALQFYGKDEAEYRAHLRRKVAELQNFYRQIIMMNNAFMGQVTAIPQAPAGFTGTTGGGSVNRQEGGVDVFTSPTRVNVAERGTPELVVTQPLPNYRGGGFSLPGGRVDVGGRIGVALPGLEGRLAPLVQGAVTSGLRELVR